MPETLQPRGSASMAPSLDPVVYRGETAKRNKIVATLLTALHPTLGYLYVGRTKSAAVSAAFFTTYLTAFIAVWISLQFFPILPLVALAFGWFVMVGACLAGVLRHATAEGEDYLLKGINHPVVYAVAFVLIGIIPAYSHYFCATHLLWGVVNINDNSMYPTLVPGDTLLIDRLAFERKTPVRGAKVVVRTGVDEMNHVTLSRVLALPGDSVRLKDGKVLVNDEVLERFYYGEDGKLPEDAFAGEDVPGSKWVYVEKNDGHRYVVAGELQPRLEEDEQEVIVVSEGNLLLLPDNRSDTGKDPFVQVASANVLGRPRYILYSRSIQDEGRDPRWARIGLRID